MDTDLSDLASRSVSSDDPIELTKENQELRDLCCFLDDERKKSKRLSQEWQSFGKYTASILRNEVLGFEKKMSILQENLQKLSQENAELRDLCLFLNQMSGIGTSNSTQSDQPPPKLDTPKVEPYAAHAACVTDMNQVLESVPQYTGFTGEQKLADSKLPQETSPNGQDEKEQHQSDSNNGYVNQLEKRLERLESEKLELVKSLSAAHILAANASENKELPPNSSGVQEEREVNRPPDIEAFLDFIKEKNTSEVCNNANEKSEENKHKHFTSEEIMKLSTLIDISKRLDAIETNNSSNLQAKELAQIAALRMLITVSFRQLQSGDTSITNQMSTSEVDSNKNNSTSQNNNNTVEISNATTHSSGAYVIPSHGIIRTEV